MATATNAGANVDRAEVVIIPPLVGALLIAAGLSLHLAFPSQVLDSGWLSLAVGLPVLVVGIGLQIACVRTLRQAGTTPMFKSTTLLVRHGPYRWSRNPMYLSVLVQAAALPLVLNAAWLLALPPLLLLYFHFWVIRREERYLERKFGEAYRAYQADIGRWLAAAALSEQRRLIAALAVAGIAGPIVFTATFTAHGLLRPGYSHVAEPVSALAAGPSGWVQDLNFIVFGLLTLVFAAGLHLGVRPARRGALGPALLALGGLGLVLAGVFPARDAAGAFSDARVGHLVAAVLSFLGAGLGLLAVSRRMAADPRWSPVASYALVTGIAMVVLFVAVGALARVPDAPLHPWLGLGQRILLAVWFPCAIVLALRLLRLARSTSNTRPR